MPEFLTARQAVERVKDGDCIVNSAFLSVINPAELMGALGERRAETGAPNNLTIFCPAGFGDWTVGSKCESPVREGAVSCVVASHFTSTPETAAKAVANEIETYNLPLGVMSHMVRASAAGKSELITKIGMNLFVDPKYSEYRINAKATKTLVSDIVIDGERMLRYPIPRFDVAFIKASSADKAGNISFENESLAGDSLSVAQAVRRAGGTVIVQVEKVNDTRHRPWNVILPAAIVDIIAVCPEQTQIAGVPGVNPDYSGDHAFTAEELRDFIINREKNAPPKDPARLKVAQRAAKELRPGDIVNIGVGIPEGVAVRAAGDNMIQQVTLTVESGPIGGVPAPGKDFGSAIGPQSIWTTSQMFDLYDGGGLNVTFLGALEIDGRGNVNSHRSGQKLSGIGGFANLSQSTPRVVFCASFSSGGLKVSDENGKITILQEGKSLKFVEKVSTVSFSAENAIKNGQNVLYITERCVFRLTNEGLELIEVFPGVDLERDILKKLPFKVGVWL